MSKIICCPCLAGRGCANQIWKLLNYDDMCSWILISFRPNRAEIHTSVPRTFASDVWVQDLQKNHGIRNCDGLGFRVPNLEPKIHILEVQQGFHNLRNVAEALRLSTWGFSNSWFPLVRKIRIPLTLGVRVWA